ncbi:FAD-binding oxidoreductase [Rhizobium sp. TRM96647]|uniref:NAD(P)/FAD-dependent oxidoreductase n=1 Tax=unclassified Rhizobium TaxID=2613769 RepID=UPI0021E864D2|nr:MULTISPECIES: FAD-binding oxidoreductase [unclassified Rhizobium]MCV3739248.1 FAD-binding oxidoreductase [Rhizobium sp. TRM96647]MCV3760874.1 FAD-binding oxidoreductase [Rhizobium sp. TRM96650]
MLVVGSGYTGLHAAIELARGGREVLICDAEQIGFGCSTRNGGQISTSVKPGFATLAKAHGEATARRIFTDGRQSLAWTEAFIHAEGIECDFKVVGRFHVAHDRKSFSTLTASLKNQPKGLDVPAHVVPRAEQRSELGTDVYHGGVVFEKHASLDPGRYHAGLVRLARAAGVRLAANCKVTGLARSANGFTVETARGRVEARNVVLATNGYSGPLSRWHQRRIIPIGSYIVATEELPETLVDELIPRNRVVSDTRRVLYYFRASPDRRRILFGGRVSVAETDPRLSAPLLYREMQRLFPQLAGYRVSHSWMGYVGYTFDTLAHVGEQDGIHYAMGYCGSGVGMAGYLGMRVGQAILGKPDGRTGYGETSFPSRSYYFGKPWFLAPAVHVYRLRDRFGL